jgi:hypothetical protein
MFTTPVAKDYDAEDIVMPVTKDYDAEDVDTLWQRR